MNQTFKSVVRRWRRAVPDSEGWWLWRESHDRARTERLLIVCGSKHSEVASDAEWEEATGEKASLDGFVANYWEGTDTKTMGGYWMKESPKSAVSSSELVVPRKTPKTFFNYYQARKHWSK
jgi:hypothetical protein